MNPQSLKQAIASKLSQAGTNLGFSRANAQTRPAPDANFAMPQNLRGQPSNLDIGSIGKSALTVGSTDDYGAQPSPATFNSGSWQNPASTSPQWTGNANGMRIPPGQTMSADTSAPNINGRLNPVPNPYSQEVRSALDKSQGNLLPYGYDWQSKPLSSPTATSSFSTPGTWYQGSPGEAPTNTVRDPNGQLHAYNYGYTMDPFTSTANTGDDGKGKYMIYNTDWYPKGDVGDSFGHNMESTLQANNPSTYPGKSGDVPGRDVYYVPNDNSPIENIRSSIGQFMKNMANKMRPANHN